MTTLHLSRLSTSVGPWWSSAFVIGAAELAIGCGGGYESCEATRSCQSTAGNAGDGGSGASEAPPNGSGGSAAWAGRGAAGSVQTGGTAGNGAASGGNAGSGAGAPDVQPDTTPPTIVSVTPEDGARGVAKDANLTIVFSEPMDREKTQAAYSSVDLPPAGVDFSWSADGTTLTIDPKGELSYASDTVPSTTQAKRYAVSIATTAADSSGNALEEKIDAEFSTLRRMTQELAPRVGWVWKDASGTTAGEGYNSFMQVGVFATTWVAGLLEFDLSVLSADVHSFEKAQLELIHFSGSGEPYGPNNLGEVVCDHTNFDPLSSATLDGPPLRRIGTVSSTPTAGPRSINVLAAVVEDHAQRLSRSYRSQYRLAFSRQNPSLAASITYAGFECEPGTVALELTYLAP